MYFNAHPAAPANGHASMLSLAAQSATTNPSANRAEWDRCMAEYLRTRALVLAVHEYGPMAAMEEEVDNLKDSLSAQFGRDFGSQPEAAAVWEPVQERRRALENEVMAKYIEPNWKAQRALTMCPAPDLAAALFKADMVAVDELKHDGALPGDAFDYVAADLERFAQ